MAYYDTSNKTICLHKEDYLTNEQVIMEELLHAVQHHLLGTFYMSAKKNAEFEVKVIRDVLRNSCSHYTFENDFKDETFHGYSNWVYFMILGGQTSTKTFNDYARKWTEEVNSRYESNFNPLLLNYCIRLKHQKH